MGIEGIAKGALSIFYSITGFKHLILDRWNQGEYLPVLIFAACVALTMVWIIRAFKGGLCRLSARFGGLAFALMTVAFGIGLAIGIANMLAHMAMGMIVNAFGQIPFFGKYIAKFGNWIIGAIAGIVVMLAIGWYVLTNIGSILGQVMGAFTGSFKDWQGDGPHGAKWSYVLCGALVLAFIICHPAGNVEYADYNIPVIALVSAAFGVVTLFRTTGWGVRATELATGRLTHNILSTGEVFCINHGDFSLYNETTRKPYLNADGSQRVKKNRKCNFLNAPGAKYCGSPYCDQPLPGPWICPTCHFKGEDRTETVQLESGGTKDRTVPANGMPWKTEKCPKCATHRPVLPETTPFHPSWEDKHTSVEAIPGLNVLQGQPTAQQLAAQQLVAQPNVQPTAQQLAAAGYSPYRQQAQVLPPAIARENLPVGIELDLMPDIREKLRHHMLVRQAGFQEFPCPKCGEPYDMYGGDQWCPECGMVLRETSDTQRATMVAIADDVAQAVSDAVVIAAITYRKGRRSNRRLRDLM